MKLKKENEEKEKEKCTFKPKIIELPRDHSEDDLVDAFNYSRKKKDRDSDVLIGGDIKNGSWGVKVKPNVEDRLLERGKKASDKLELIKNQTDPKNIYRPILNQKSLKMADKKKKQENLGNWGSLVKF